MQAVRLRSSHWSSLIESFFQVERALECWKEGQFSKKDLPEFSKNNFGDTFTKAEKNAKRIRRATIFVKTLERLTNAEWTAIIEEAREWLDDNKRARATSTSPNTTLESENVVEDPVEDFVMVL